MFRRDQQHGHRSIGWGMRPGHAYSAVHSGIGKGGDRVRSLGNRGSSGGSWRRVLVLSILGNPERLACGVRSGLSCHKHVEQQEHEALPTVRCTLALAKGVTG